MFWGRLLPIASRHRFLTPRASRPREGEQANEQPEGPEDNAKVRKALAVRGAQVRFLNQLRAAPGSRGIPGCPGCIRGRRQLKPGSVNDIG